MAYPDRKYRIDYLHQMDGDGMSYEVPEMLAYRMAQEGFCRHGNIINSQGQEITGQNSKHWEFLHDYSFVINDGGEYEVTTVDVLYLGQKVRGHNFRQVEDAIYFNRNMTKWEFWSLILEYV